MATLGVLDILISIKDGNVTSELSKTESKVKVFGDKMSSWTVAKGQMIGRFAENAVRSASRVIKNTVSETVAAFGKYEQLSEGAKLLFGDAYDYIEKRSKEAYKNVQMSQNEYFEQANAYATGLKVSLDGDAQAAAELADKIITAQADVVAATGANRESVENAFKGLLRGNYTMLDNLQLGIKGTKKGMEEVIDRVNAWHKANKRATQYQMDNLADMNNALVDYIEMQGLAGYAENEGLNTLEGSIASTKAAWKDLITNIGRGKDIKDSVKRFGEAAKHAFTNLRPVIKNSVQGIFSTVKELLPEVGELLKDLTKDMKESDIPIVRVLGTGLEKVQLAFEGVNALIEDFPGTVQKLQMSDDPFAKFIGGGLKFGYDAFNWIVKKSGSVEQALTNIAIGFAAIKIAPGLSTFVVNLLKLAGMGGSWIGKLFGGGAGASAGAETGATGGASWLSKLSKFKPAAGAVAFLTTLFDTTGKAWFSGTPDTEHYGQFFESDGTLTEAGRNAGLSADDLEVRRSAAYSTWRHNKTMSNLENLLQYKDYNTDVLSFVKGLSGRDQGNLGQWTQNLQNRWNNWFWNDAPDKELDAVTEAMDQAMFDRMYKFMEDFGTADGSLGVAEVEDFFGDLQGHLEEQLAKSPYKVDVDPNVNIDSIRSQLQSQNYTIPVTAQIMYGKVFGFRQAKGDWSVPYDNYPSLLHRGEIVLNQSQARRYRDGESEGGGLNIPSLIAKSVKESMKQVNFLLNGNKVADLTQKRTNKNIKAQSYSTIKAYGG